MRKVFIPNDNPGRDYESAKAFGELVVITSGPVNALAAGALMQTVRARMKDAAADDFVIASGIALMPALAAAYMAHRFGRVNFLQWTRRGYREAVVWVQPPEWPQVPASSRHLGDVPL